MAHPLYQIPQRQVFHMTKKTHKDPMITLIIVMVLATLLAVGAWIGINALNNYRSDALEAERNAVEARNQEKQDAFDAEVQAYIDQINRKEPNQAWPEAASEGWDVIDLSTFPLEAPENVTVTRRSAMFGGLLLVNEFHTRPGDFDETEMVSLNSYIRGANTGLESFWDDSTCKLHPVAIDALVEMLQSAKTQGYTHYVVQKENNFRTYSEQEAKFNAELERQRTRRPNMSEQELIDRARKNVNYPGTSEFNSGLSFCLKLYVAEEGELKQYYREHDFYDTADGQWLLDNAWRYGFVFRFPTNNFPTEDTVDKAYKTGMNLSLNCYRYVGKGNAAVMNHLDLCLEEYIEYLMEHPHIAVFENGEKRYEIHRQEVGNDSNVSSYTVQLNTLTNNYSISLDNMGGLITVYDFTDQ